MLQTMANYLIPRTYMYCVVSSHSFRYTVSHNQISAQHWPRAEPPPSTSISMLFNSHTRCLLKVEMLWALKKSSMPAGNMDCKQIFAPRCRPRRRRRGRAAAWPAMHSEAPFGSTVSQLLLLTFHAHAFQTAKRCVFCKKFLYESCLKNHINPFFKKIS